jgi:hypothetical protein
MYEVMGAIAGAGMPVVYKGAMITKLILRENHYDEVSRETQDIDFNWTSPNLPSTEQLKEMLNRALAGFGMTAAMKREYGEEKSAGFRIFDAKGFKKLSIDIEMRAVTYSRTYQYENVTFSGVTPISVIGDKINAISSDKLCRRTKDLVDIYALAHCVKIQKSELHKYWMKENRPIGTFKTFMNRREDVEHAYNKLRRVIGKPGFRELYEYLNAFLAPFIEPTPSSEFWDNKKSAWVFDESLNHNPDDK